MPQDNQNDAYPEHELSETTNIMHLHDQPQAQFGAVNPPVYHASLFAFPNYEAWKDHVSQKQPRQFVYHRSGNPTIRLLEEKVAHLERAADCVASSSGMSAIAMTILALVQTGDHVLCVQTVYGPVRRFFASVLRKFGVEVSYFPADASADLTPYLRDNTRLIYLESPASLTFDIQDLRAVANLARPRNIWTVIDNTWATPLYQRPLELGIDVSVHFGTKYISGHSDLLLGLVAGNASAMEKIRAIHPQLGASLSPDDAYLALRGLRTLPVRLKQHEQSGLKIARWMQEQPEVREVLHPGLEAFPGNALHRSQCTGDSALFGFRLRPRGEQARAAFVNSLKLFHLGYSWGGFESLLVPLAFSYYGNESLRKQLGLDDDSYRISVGLEDPDDIIRDLSNAFKAYRNA
jgi:cystathionine beta-lyase